MTKQFKVALTLIAGLAMVGGTASRALAQNDPTNTRIPSLELQDADVREALRALFRNVGNVQYTIAPDIQGLVTVSMHDQTFEACLRNILNQVDATYRIESGVYQIIKREAPVTPTPGENPTTPTGAATKLTRRIQIRHADPQLIALLIGQDKGNQSYTLPPEITAVATGGSQGGFGGGMGGGGFGGGGFGGGMGGGGFGGGGFGGGGFGGGGFGGGGFGGGGGGFGGGGFGGGGGLRG